MPALPNFFVIGAPRCATTAICRHVAAHPDVFFSNPKEPHFFGLEDDEFSAGLNQYERLFDGSERFAAVGEGSTSYSDPAKIERVIQRIARIAPESKLIMIVRHPLKRIESAWKLAVNAGDRFVTEDFSGSVNTFPWLVRHTRYWDAIDACRTSLPDSPLLLLFYEDFCRDPESTLRRIFSHIGVSSEVPLEKAGAVVHSSESKVRLPPTMQVLSRNRLCSYAWSKVRGRLRPVAHRFFAQPPNLQTVWERSVWEDVTSQLQPGAQRLLTANGKSADFWDFRDVTIRNDALTEL